MIEIILLRIADGQASVYNLQIEEIIMRMYELVIIDEQESGVQLYMFEKKYTYDYMLKKKTL
jgi:hypothetical protein